MGYPRQTIRDFSGGLNTQVLPAELVSADGTMQFPILKNLMIHQAGRLRARGGQHVVVGEQGSAPHGIHHYVGASLEALLLAVDTHVKAFHMNGVLIGDIATVDAAKNVAFASLDGVVYFVDVTNVAQKWAGTGTAVRMGIVPPVAAPTATPGAAGNLESSQTGQVPYLYYVTFVNTVTGTESNPSPASAGQTVNAKKIDLSAIPISTDAQVNARRIYRFGGTSSANRLVTEIGDNTTTTYTDNTADIDLELTTMSIAHDVPPTGISFLFAHKSRLLAAGDAANPNRCYVSTFEGPEYWPIAQEDPAVDGGYFPVSHDFGDPIIGFGASGSTALIFNAHSLYALFGDSFDDGGSGFVIRRIADIGCASRLSIVTCVNETLFMGEDGLIYGVQDNAITNHSGDIERTLRALTPAERATACAIYIDQRYILFVPRANGVSPVNFALDFRVGKWIDLSDDNLSGTQLCATSATGAGQDVLFQTKAGYPGGYHGIMSFLSDANNGENLPIDFATPEFEYQEEAYTNRARRLRIDGTYVAWDDTDPLRAYVYARTDGRPDIWHSYKMNGRTSKLLETELHSDLVGRRLQVRIAGNVKSCEITTIVFEFGSDTDERV